MGVWFRRLRAALGTAVTWAVGWAVVGMALSILGGVAPLSGIILGAMSGFWSGGAFAVVLGVMERKRTLADLRIPRIIFWGAVAGMVPPATSLLAVGLGGEYVPVPAILLIVGTTGVLGAGCSAGSLLLVRRAKRQELETGAMDELEAGSSP